MFFSVFFLNERNTPVCFSTPERLASGLFRRFPGATKTSGCAGGRDALLRGLAVKCFFF